MSKERAVSRRAWTPERVHRFLDILQEINVRIGDLAAAELRVGDILEKALVSDSTNFDEGVKEGHRQAQAGME